MSAATLKITDGTTNIDFTGSYYKILTAGGWAPRRAGRRQSQLAGMSPYEDVLETMYIRIVGSSVANCLALLEDLSELLDQAERWGKGENVTPVEIQYKPTGSALASAVTANIVGPPEGGDFLTLPSDFDAVDDRNYALGTHANPIILQFVRRGLWLGTTEDKSEAESSGNPEIMTTDTFTNTEVIHCPHRVLLAVNRAANSEPYEVYTLIQNSAVKLLLTEVEGFTNSATGSATFTSGTSTAVAAASGGYVARLTFSDGSETGTAISGTLNAEVYDRWAWYMVADNNTSNDIAIQLYTRARAAGSPYVKGPKTIIPATDTVPKIYFLGITSSTEGVGVIKFEATVVDGSATSYIDFDYIAGIYLDDNAHIVRFPAALDIATDTSLFLDHRIDGYVAPLAYEVGSGTYGYVSYNGNPAVYLTGNACSALVLGVDNAGDWNIDNGSGSDATITLTSTKTEGYLTPI